MRRFTWFAKTRNRETGERSALFTGVCPWLTAAMATEVAWIVGLIDAATKAKPADDAVLMAWRAAWAQDVSVVGPINQRGYEWRTTSALVRSRHGRIDSRSSRAKATHPAVGARSADARCTKMALPAPARGGSSLNPTTITRS